MWLHEAFGSAVPIAGPSPILGDFPSDALKRSWDFHDDFSNLRHYSMGGCEAAPILQATDNVAIIGYWFLMIQNLGPIPGDHGIYFR